MADPLGWVLTFTPTAYADRVAVSCKSLKGEVTKAADETFRHLMVAEFGDRDGFRYTDASNQYDGEGNLVEYHPPVTPRAPLTEEHKQALMEGKQRAAAARREAAEETLTVVKVKVGRKQRKDPDPIGISMAALAQERERRRDPADDDIPDADTLYERGFYRVACLVCGEGIKRTGKTGRAPRRHETCK